MNIGQIMVTKILTFFKRFEAVIIVGLIILLCALPFIQLFSEKMLGLVIPDIDVMMVNLVFLFACFASMVTWRNNKHICIATVDQLVKGKVKFAINIFKSLITPAILIALFFAAFSEFFVLYYPEDTIWGIQLRLIYAFLPLSYLAMIIMTIRKKENAIFSILGIVLGFCISSGQIANVLYALFQPEDLTFYDTIWYGWIDFATASLVPLVIVLILSAFLGVPLFLVLAALAYVAFTASSAGYDIRLIPVGTYSILTDKSIAAIPLFTIAGYILSKGSAGKRLIDIFGACFGWFKGGVIVATVLVAAFFTTMTGISGATILALGALLTSVLVGAGYSKDRAESLVTSSGAIGLLFPPSLAIIMYGTVNYFSVDVFALFKGAILPGIVLAGAMVGVGIFYSKDAEKIPFSSEKLVTSLKNGIFEILLPVCIIGGYFGGLFTLFQTAAFAVLYTFIIGVWIRKDFTLKKAVSIVIESLPTTGGVLAIFGAARGLSDYILFSDIPFILSDFVLTHIESKIVFLLLVNLVLIVVGCLMDIYSAILIVSPLLIPIADTFGIHPVHMGVIFLMNMQLGFLTPPVGMDLFISSYAFDKPVVKVVKGILPFLLIQFLVVLLVTYVPWFTTILL